MKTLKGSKSRSFPSILNVFFYRFESYAPYKRARKQNCIYKLNSDDEILSSLIKRGVHVLF